MTDTGQAYAYIKTENTKVYDNQGNSVAEFNSVQAKTVVPARPRSQQLPPPEVPVIDNHMSLAIFSFLCCCWPVGLCAVRFSMQVKDDMKRKKFDEAKQKAEQAKKLSIISIVLGSLIFLIIVIVLIAVAA